MSTQYCLVQSGKTASSGCSAGQGLSELWRHRFFYFKEYLLELMDICEFVHNRV
jgi:hypothetical protein